MISTTCTRYVFRKVGYAVVTCIYQKGEVKELKSRYDKRKVLGLLGNKVLFMWFVFDLIPDSLFGSPIRNV